MQNSEPQKQSEEISHLDLAFNRLMENAVLELLIDICGNKLDEHIKEPYHKNDRNTDLD